MVTAKYRPPPSTNVKGSTDSDSEASESDQDFAYDAWDPLIQEEKDHAARLKEKEEKKNKTKSKGKKKPKPKDEDDEEEEDHKQGRASKASSAKAKAKSNRTGPVVDPYDIDTDGDPRGECVGRYKKVAPLRFGSSDESDADPVKAAQSEEEEKFQQGSRPAGQVNRKAPLAMTANPKRGGGSNALPLRSSLPAMSDRAWNEYKVVFRHKAGRWRKNEFSKRNPQIMSKYRAELERVHNPLIKLLGINILLTDEQEVEELDTDSDLSAGESEVERDRAIRAERPIRKYPKSDAQAEVVRSQLLSDEGSAESDNVSDDCKDDIRMITRSPVVKRESRSSNSPFIVDVRGDEDQQEMAEDGNESPPEPDTESDTEPHPSLKSSIVKVDEDEDDIDPFAASYLAAQRRAEAEKREAARQAAEKIRVEEDLARFHRERVRNPVPLVEESQITTKSSKPILESRHHLRPKLEDLPKLTAANMSSWPLIPGYCIPAPINRFLRDYQREGVKFLFRQYDLGVGGILGDDMGLGKTIQVIAFLSAITQRTGTNKDRDRRSRQIDRLTADDEYPSASSYGPTILIACPATLTKNWYREITRWSYLETPDYNDDRTAKNLRDVIKRFRKGYYDIIILSTDAVRLNIDVLKTLDLSVIIIDEVHKIKTIKSSVAKAFRQFPTVLRYGLTGTAIQNRLEEFRSILDWACPGAVGTPKQWQLFVSDPLKFGCSAKATENEIVTMRLRAEALVRNLLPKFFLRRTKELIADQMPRKTDNIIICPLTPLQLRVYKRLLQDPKVQAILTHADPCDCGQLDASGNAFQKGKCCKQDWYKEILAYIFLFRCVANHVALIYPNKEDVKKNPERYSRMVSWINTAFDEGDRETRIFSPLMTGADLSLCGKWHVLKELLEMWSKQGAKVLIFSGSIPILTMLATLMEMNQYSFVKLDGTTKGEDRMTAVDEFNNNPDVFCFLISVLAGGTGLNLTAANKVIIFDPNWNPAVDLQAMDRAFRIGQKRDVDVYRMVGAGTLEELIYNRQQYKRAQAGLGYEATAEGRFYNGVEGEKDQQGELFGVENLFTLQANVGLTKSIIEARSTADLEWATNMVKGVTATAQIADAAPDKVKTTEAELRLAEILSGTTKVEHNDATSRQAALIEEQRAQALLEEYTKAQRKPLNKKKKRGVDSLSLGEAGGSDFAKTVKKFRFKEE